MESIDNCKNPDRLSVYISIGEFSMSDSTSIKKNGVEQPDLFPPGQDQELALSRRKLPKHKHNPFVDDHLITQLSGQKNVYYSQNTRNSLVDLETGEIEPAKLQVIKKIRADKEQFVKVYTTHLKAFFELSTGAYKLLQYVLYTIQNDAINKDKVYLSVNSAQEFFIEQGSKISSSAYYKAMKELVEKLFLAETTGTNIYFINLKLFFNGDRVDFITKFQFGDSDKKHTLDGYKSSMEQLGNSNPTDSEAE